MPLIEARHRRTFLTLFVVFILFGTSFTIIGATLPKILAEFQWSYLAAGTVLGAGSIAYFLSTFAAGYLIKLFGPKPTIMLGLILDVVGLAFFASTPAPFANTLLSALIGLGQGFVEVSINSATLRLDPKHTGRPMNLMHGAFAVGAILGPLSVGLLLQNGQGWTMVYRGMAVLFGLLAVLILMTPLPSVAKTASDAEEHPDEKPARLSSHPAYWLSFFALLVYVGVELGVSNWIAEYFVAVFAYDAAASALLVSLFWTGLLAGRFGVPLMYKGERHDAVLIGLSILATASITLLSLLGYATPNSITHYVGRVLVFLAGLGCSIYYPAVITLLGKCFPHAQSQAIGFASTGGGIGAFMVPFLMSAMSQHWGIRAGFASYGVFSVVMTGLVIWLVISAKRKNGDSNSGRGR